ncbi:MAG TPA: PIN domain-containing protein [Candidatus Deferrimicrobiaceae bacterium]
MKPAVFVDTDVVLDLLARREPFHLHAARLFTLADRGVLKVCVSSLSFSNLHYILRKETSGKRAVEILKAFRKLVTILPVDDAIVAAALDSGFPDFEDAIQYHAAMSARLTVLLTRNCRDYRKPAITVCTPEEYLAR